MVISVTELKARFLEIIRGVERDGDVVEIMRHGEVVARLLPVFSHEASPERPWERLRGTAVLVASAEESVLEESDFDAVR